MRQIAPTVVYLLCLATSALCAGLVLRAWRRSRARLLLWTSLSFVCLALNNLLLVLDLLVFPATDLWILRQVPLVAALGCLLYGFIWDAER